MSLFFCSIGDDNLKDMNVNLDSVADTGVADCNIMEKQSKVTQNGFSSALVEEDSCDERLTQKSHVMPTSELCPVGPHKATLLYPLHIR